MYIRSPVAGLTPWRASRWATENLPNPVMAMSWPAARPSSIAAIVALSASPAWLLLRPDRWAICSTSSFLFMDPSFGRRLSACTLGVASVGRLPWAAMVTVDGLAIEVADLPGDGARRALVLLHEGLGSVGLWRGFPQQLRDATGRRVVAFSRFGHGRSDPPRAPRTS